jgi:hypothetical protein
MGTMSEGPYFALEGNDVLMYSDRAHAEAHLEYIDVNNGLDTIFRADGTLLRLATAGKKVIISDEIVRKDPAALATALTNYLLSAANSSALDERETRAASLPELVAAFARTVRSR